jgi:hypothetical protein
MERRRLGIGRRSAGGAGVVVRLRFGGRRHVRRHRRRPYSGDNNPCLDLGRDRAIQDLAKTANADFILRRVDQFFRPETRMLLHLIEDDYLLFQEQKPFQNSYFMVDEPRIACLHDDIKMKLLEKRTYSTYEIDDMILGPWEDLGSLEEEGLISFNLIYDFFSWYICRAWQNQKIRRYIDGARAEREEGKDLYNKLQSLAQRCLERERSQAANR